MVCVSGTDASVANLQVVKSTKVTLHCCRWLTQSEVVVVSVEAAPTTRSARYYEVFMSNSQSERLTTSYRCEVSSISYERGLQYTT